MDSLTEVPSVLFDMKAEFNPNVKRPKTLPNRSVMLAIKRINLIDCDAQRLLVTVPIYATECDCLVVAHVYHPTEGELLGWASDHTPTYLLSRGLPELNTVQSRMPIQAIWHALNAAGITITPSFSIERDIQEGMLAIATMFNCKKAYILTTGA